MLQDHPVITWGSIVFGVLFGIGSIVGVTWNFLAQDTHNTEILEFVKAIRAEQVAIRGELALQTEDIDAVKDRQGDIKDRQGDIQRSLADILTGHRWLASEINRSTDTFGIELGKLLERTQKQ